MHAFKLTLGISIICAIFLIDLYCWQALKTIIRHRSPRFKKNAKRVHYGAMVLFILLTMSSFMITALEVNKWFRIYLSAFVFIIYLSKFITFLFVFMDDIQRFVQWLLRIAKSRRKEEQVLKTEEQQGITRSQFLAQAGIIAGGIPLVLMTRGIFKGAYDYRIHRVPLYLSNLPDAFEGLKLLQVSDIHSGSLFQKDAVQKGIQMIRDEKPDLVFFTGDLVNNKTDEAYDYAELFSTVKAPMGVFSTFGNHDYGDYMEWDSKEAKAKNLDDLVAVHRDLGWHLMRNEHVTIDRNGQRIGIIGVENWGDRGRFQKFGDIDAARAGMPDVPVKLLLSHDPSHFDAIISKSHTDIDATFSGHTHGFQFGVEFGNIKWSPSQFIYPHWAGLYQVGTQQLYVNRGFGFLGYPGRVGILPEITVFELKKRV